MINKYIKINKTSNLKSLSIYVKEIEHIFMILQIEVLAWDRHINIARSSRLMYVFEKLICINEARPFNILTSGLLISNFIILESIFHRNNIYFIQINIYTYWLSTLFV
jgi:hypothetical protein